MISSITLTHFRNYTQSRFEFSPFLTCLVGDNAIGKTNLIEALFLSSHGKSFRAVSDSDMIFEGKEIGRVSAEIQTSDETYRLETILTLGMVMGKQTRPKLYSINTIGKRMVDFIGTFKTVLFWPEDLELITGSPTRRRRYLDFVLSNTDREYRRTLVSYEKGMRSRNKVLEVIREGIAQHNQLIFWDQLLIKEGGYITKKRQEYIEYLNTTGVKQSGVSFGVYKAIYDASIISRARLDQYKNAEVAAGVTLVGPHRDDIKIAIGNFTLQGADSYRDLARFGSRGEQRLAILWLKRSELLYIEHVTSEKPTLLLDDIFSELDHGHRDMVLQICQSQQTIMTTTDIHFLEHILKKDMKLIQLGK